MNRKNISKKRKIEQVLFEFKKDKAAIFSILCLLVIIVLALLAPILPLHPNETNISHILEAPSTAHWFGTD